MQMETSFIETEDRFNWGDNSGTMLCVVNKDKKNTWGENRGYRIIPGRSAIHLTPQTSPWSQKNSEFAKQNIAVSRVHDTEPLANSFQNVNLPQAPQQDFSKFFDGESLDQEDLVVWFNLGMHHFTRAEDIPVTLYTEAYSSIVFAPQNFFDRAQDGDLLNRRWVVPAENGQLEYEDLDVALPKCSINPTEPVLGISPVLEI
jgi:primary-amine oxidase